MTPPTITTDRHVNRFDSADAIGPDERVMPVCGIGEGEEEEKEEEEKEEEEEEEEEKEEDEKAENNTTN